MIRTFVGVNAIMTGGSYPNNTVGTVSVSGNFYYDTVTNKLATVPDPFSYQFYANGNLILNCVSCGGVDFSVNSGLLDGGNALGNGHFDLTASLPLDGSVPIVPGTDGFMWVFAPFGTTATGSFVEAPLPTPLPPALPLFAAAVAGLGSVGWK